MPTSGEIQDAELLQFGAYVSHSGAALLAYEYCLTLRNEIAHIWHPKKSLVFGLFISLRYATLVFQVLCAASSASQYPINAKSCVPANYMINVTSLTSSAALSGILILRTFAVWNRNRAILVLLCAVASAKVLLTAILSFRYTHIVSGYNAISTLRVCAAATAPVSNTLATSISALVVLFDTVVLLLTIAKTLQTAIASRRFRFQYGYGFFVLRDGLLYYIAIDILVIATVVISQTSSSAVVVAILEKFRHPLSSILIQRFILNLRHESYVEVHPSENSMDLPPVQFARGPIIGHIGAPLRTTSDFNGASDSSQDAEATGVYAH